MSSEPKEMLPLTQPRAVRALLRIRDTLSEGPRLLPTFALFLAICFLLFCRLPTTNYIFDEQEALLANPYVNAADGLTYLDAIHRDFWGLPPDRSIGSYRPLPNFLWRALWFLTEKPFFHHLLNLVIHALNATLLALFARGAGLSPMRAYLVGGCMLVSAVLTEAVSGIVGLADVLGGLGAVLALLALRLPAWGMPVGVFVAVTIGLFSKESALVCVPLVPLAALLLAGQLHPKHPFRFGRAALSLLAALAAFVLYVELRKAWFPSPLPTALSSPLPSGSSEWQRLLRDVMVWFHQAPLPKDPLNNPLAEADTPQRIGGALRVYARGLGQVVFPSNLSGDYSYAAEPVPEKLWFGESIVGAAAMAGPIALGAGLGAVGVWRETRGKVAGGLLLAAVGLIWIVVAYFPHSNIPVVLPTVRAERFWYFPVIGSSLVLALLLDAASRRLRRYSAAAGAALVATFFAVQGVQAYRHAADYRDDLSFWRATKDAVPRSAKAHLNYSVMVGARGDLETRLHHSFVAQGLAPEWPMARIYTGDTLCRMGRVEEGFPHYVQGFELGPNHVSLIALALQCLWDKGAIEGYRTELRELSSSHPGTWLAYLASDILVNGEKHDGVDPQYRPRGYNQKRRDPDDEADDEAAEGSTDESASDAATAEPTLEVTASPSASDDDGASRGAVKPGL